MAPGPTEVPPTVLAAACQPIIHHRTSEFRSIFSTVCRQLKAAFMTESPVMVFSATGTGGMEAVLLNLSQQGDKVIVISGGVFGERWAKIAETLDRTVIRIAVEWGSAADPDLVRETLMKHQDAVLVCGTLTETSTGVDHPVKEIASIVSQFDACFAVDGISGIGAVEMRMDEWGIDIAIAGSQKGFMVPPGLTLIALSDKAQSAMKRVAPRTSYFSFDAALKNLTQGPLPDTPWTPCVSLIIQLHESLKLLLEEGMEAIWERHALLAQAVRASVSTLGLQLFAQDSPSNAITSVYSPEGIPGSKIVETMRQDWGISIVGGQGKIKPLIFRIGHLGYCDRADVLMVIAVLETVLQQLQVPVRLGTGVKAAQEVFLEQYALQKTI